MANDKDIFVANMTEGMASSYGYRWEFTHEGEHNGKTYRYGDAFTVNPDRVHNPFGGDKPRPDTFDTWDSYRYRDINDNLTDEYNKA